MLKLTEIDSLLVTLCVGVSKLLWLPVMGAVSDRVGRQPVLVLFTALAILTAYPALSWLVAAPSFERMLMVELWLSFLYASYNGAMVGRAHTDSPRQRPYGRLLARLQSCDHVGGLTPYISTLLIQQTGDKAAPGLWMTFAAACGLLATFLVYRRGEADRVLVAAAALIGSDDGGAYNTRP